MSWGRALIATLLCLPLVLCSGCSVSPPSIVCRDPYVDLGLVKPTGDVVAAKHVFTLTNLGMRPLKIHKVRPSCGCTNVSVEKDTVKSGESVSVIAEIAIPRQALKQEVTLIVSTNDPVKPMLPLVLNIMSEGCMQVEPAQIDFGTLSYGETQAKHLTIRYQSSSETLPPALERQVFDNVILEPAGNWRRERHATHSARPFYIFEHNVSATVRNEAGRGDLSRTAEIQLPEFKSLPRFHAKWTEAPEFVFEPDVLHLGLVEAGQAVEMSVRVNFRDDVVDSGSVTVEGDGFSLHKTEEREGGLTVSVGFAGERSGRFSGRLMFLTKDRRIVQRELAAVIQGKSAEG